MVRRVRSYGIQRELTNRMENELHERKQKVMGYGCFSDWKTVISGMPQ